MAVHVTIAATEQQFHDIQPGNAPQWADGTAYPALGAIYLRSPRVRGGMAAPLEQVLEHEIVHILLGRAFWPQRPPSWLQEGYAQVLSGEVGPETARQIASGMATGGLIELDQLVRGFPADPLRARLAYAQSADFVAWIGETYGAEARGEIVARMARGDDVHAAVRHVTGESLEEVDHAWRSRLTAGIPISLSILADDNFLWGFGAFCMVVAAIIRIRESRRRRAQMALDEAQHEAVIQEAIKTYVRDTSR